MELLLARGVPRDAYVFGSTALATAAGNGHIEAMKLLLAKGSPVDGHAPDGGQTPLHSAVHQSQLAAAQLLVEKGANVNAISGGRTPLLMMMETRSLGEKDRPVIALLLANKADPNAKGTSGKTALAIATENKDPETAALLRQHGAQ
jgi:ankyrin repeat protein